MLLLTSVRPSHSNYLNFVLLILQNVPLATIKDELRHHEQQLVQEVIVQIIRVSTNFILLISIEAHHDS